MIVVPHIENLIYVYEQEINKLSLQGNTAQTLRTVNGLNKQIKQKTALDPANVQMALLKEQLNLVAADIFAKAVDGNNQNLYVKINEKIEDAYEAAQDNLAKLNALQDEIVSRIREGQYINKLQDYGKRVEQLTNTEQVNFAKTRALILPMQAKLMDLRTNDEIDKQLFPLETELEKLKQQLEVKIETLPVNSQLTIASYRQNIEQKNLMLKFLVNPGLIATLTPEDLALFTPDIEVSVQTDEAFSNLPPIVYMLKGQLVIDQQSINEILSNISGVPDILKQIDKKQQEVNAIKQKNKISEIENQISFLKTTIYNIAGDVFTNSIDPQDGRNLFAKINALVFKLNQDNVIQEKMKRMRSFEQGLVDSVQGQVAAIRNFAKTIKANTKPEQLKTEGLLSQLYAQKALLKPDKNLAEMEQTKKQKENKVKEIISQMSDINSQVRRYNDSMAKLQLLLDFIRSPKEAAQATPKEILLQQKPYESMLNS